MSVQTPDGEAPAPHDEAAPAPDEQALPPVIRVVAGSPSPEELAALVAVLTARGGAQVAGQSPTPSTWASPHRAVRADAVVSHGGWRASALPR